MSAQKAYTELALLVSVGSLLVLPWSQKVRSLCEYEVFPLNLGIKQEKESGHRF